MNIIQNNFETISDERGDIIKIAKNVDVLRIISKKGSIRASHYHIHSSHLCSLLSGSMYYYERDVGSDISPVRLYVKPREYFFTGNMKEHLMVFLEDSVFDCYSFGSRDKIDYENDVVRISHNLEEIYISNLILI